MAVPCLRRELKLEFAYIKKKVLYNNFPIFQTIGCSFYFDPVSVLHQFLCQLKYPQNIHSQK